MGITNEELIKRLRSDVQLNEVAEEAADRIEHLKTDRDGWISNAYAALDWQRDAEYKLEAAEAKLAKAVEAQRKAEAKLARAVETLQFYVDTKRSARAALDAVLAELEKTE